MGEEAKQEEEVKQEEKPAEEKKEEPKPSAPLVIHVDLHCAGCAKKIQRYVMKIRGVEGVEVDKTKNQLTIKGIVEHQAVCDMITKKTKRKVTVISPTPEAEGQPIPEVVTSQVDSPRTVELLVNMHCEACAEQLKEKILKMKGVQTATTELATGKVRVIGTMDGVKLVDYVYRRTKKLAQIVPQPEPEKKESEAPPAEEEKPAPPPEEEKKEEDKKEEEKKEEEKKEEKGEEKKEEPPAEEKKEGSEQKEESKTEATEKKDDPPKESEGERNAGVDEENLKKMIYYYQPLYVIERMPAPQLFSDENPNACCIS